MPSNVLVSGFEEPLTSFNGLYLYAGIRNDKPFYRLEGVNEGDQELFWIPPQGESIFSFWLFENDNTGEYGASSLEPLIPFVPPWESPQWFDVNFEVLNLIVTEVPVFIEPTFGLPADTVALITSRFGTVANFLRLRNQGQV
jgi:hypothetical protein